MKSSSCNYTVIHTELDKDNFPIPETITALKTFKTLVDADKYLRNECKQYPLNELYIRVLISKKEKENGKDIVWIPPRKSRRNIKTS